MLKLYVAVRNDIDVPFQMCQVAHAVADFAREHPEEFLRWNKGNNTICVVQVPDDRGLERLIEIANDGYHKHAAFYEPHPTSLGWPESYYDPHRCDQDGPWLTAVAFAPNWYMQNVILADLPLALDHKTVKEKAGLPVGYVPIERDEMDNLRHRAAILRRLKTATPGQRRAYFRDGIVP